MAVSEARARRASSSASASLRTSSFQPASRDARRTFCPFLPMASASWSSGTITSMACSSSSMMIFDTLAGARARDLLLLGEDGVGAPQVHDDVFLLEALHDAGEELALAPLELVVDDIALGVAHALDDVLLRGLGGDAPELLRRQLGEELVADLGLRIDLRARHLERHLVLGVLDVLDHRLDLEQLDLAQLGVELGLDVLLVAEGLLGRRQHRLLERLQDDVAVDALLLAHLLDDAIQVRQHGSLLA